MRDPRFYQMTVLGSLLAYGLIGLDFEIGRVQVVVTIAAALVTQAVASRAAGLPRVEWKSAMISSLSLCLLLRTQAPWLAAAAAIVAVGSKFVVRSGGKHIFNPTNLALVAMLAVTDRVWVSSGQWGSATTFGFLLACLGTVVVTRAQRADVSFAFLAAWTAILALRSLQLGEPMTIPLHRLESGSLLLFAFFMISDPKTTPDARSGRVVFAILVAAFAWFVQFKLFRPNALLWSLAAVSPLVPVPRPPAPREPSRVGAAVLFPFHPEVGHETCAPFHRGDARGIRGCRGKRRGVLRFLRVEGRCQALQ